MTHFWMLICVFSCMCRYRYRYSIGIALFHWFVNQNLTIYLILMTLNRSSFWILILTTLSRTSRLIWSVPMLFFFLFVCLYGLGLPLPCLKHGLEIKASLQGMKMFVLMRLWPCRFIACFFNHVVHVFVPFWLVFVLPFSSYILMY